MCVALVIDNDFSFYLKLIQRNTYGPAYAYPTKQKLLKMHFFNRKKKHLPTDGTA